MFGPSKTRKYEGLGNEEVWSPSKPEPDFFAYGWINLDDVVMTNVVTATTYYNVGYDYSAMFAGNHRPATPEVSFADVWSMKDAAVQSYTPRKK